MRDKLKPPTPDYAKVRLLMDIVKNAVAARDHGQSVEIDEEQCREIAGAQVDICELEMAADEMNLETVVKALFVPRPTLRNDITEDDLLDIVTAYQRQEIPQHEREYWRLMLEIHLPSTDVSDLIVGGAEAATPAEYIAMARGRRPILL